MSCEHEWQYYLGFVESYWFCLLCDEKSKELEPPVELPSGLPPERKNVFHGKWWGLL